MPFRKFVGLILSIALIISGALLMILWDHPLSIIWDDPVKIFWEPDFHGFRINRYWFVGPLLLALILWRIW